uniref:Uncharacterized protein n=2 Tax=Oryza sativa subsp. japonica TaxID=39947 RepID=Q5SMI7_ORYSJ|nr:hypothetical protein [Oryza sativa Japonica Group]BAD72569.1 hypothetical protein [Oryza sativa Japonica Group]
MNKLSGHRRSASPPSRSAIHATAAGSVVVFSVSGQPAGVRPAGGEDAWVKVFEGFAYIPCDLGALGGLLGELLLTGGEEVGDGGGGGGCGGGAGVHNNHGENYRKR